MPGDELPERLPDFTSLHDAEALTPGVQSSRCDALGTGRWQDRGHAGESGPEQYCDIRVGLLECVVENDQLLDRCRGSCIIENDLPDPSKHSRAAREPARDIE